MLMMQIKALEGDVHALLQPLPVAFPALKTLTLFAVGLGDGELFKAMVEQHSYPLQSLVLEACSINPTAVDAAAAALAQLAGLQSLVLSDLALLATGVMRPLASQLTGLTSLVDGLFTSGEASAVDWLLGTVRHNPGLQGLCAMSIQLHLQAADLKCILTCCPGLTQLNLRSSWIDDHMLDVLLTHGKNITHLTVGIITLSTNRAASSCNWQSLQVLCTPDTIGALAHLPLRTVKTIGMGPDGISTSRLALKGTMPEPQLLPLLQQAATNVVASPAWQQTPASHILLSIYTPLDAPLDVLEGQHLQLLAALAPLKAPQVKHLSLEMGVRLGKQEVETLASSLGSSLTSLKLSRGFILASFWPALAQHFPGLCRLTLTEEVAAQSCGIQGYLFRVSQPFTLLVNESVMKYEDFTALKECLDAWQMDGIDMQCIVD
jgi:hypothetical protein